MSRVAVIGSGPGGLTAAVALARAGHEVDVFEQHYLPGGYTHGFAREGFRFSPGVHYIGELGPGGAARRLFEGLGLGRDLVFLELNPDGYDRVRIGDERFDIPVGASRYAERLAARFPGEREGAKAYVETALRISATLRGSASPARGASALLERAAGIAATLRYGARSLDRFLDGFTKDPLLRAILSIQAGDHGMAPSRAPAALHVALLGHYVDGAWYPKGGGAALPRAFLRELRRNGGRIHLRSPVARVLTERHGRLGGKRASGIRLKNGTEVRADLVVSNADPVVTWLELVAPEDVPAALRRRVTRARWSISCLSLLLAVDMDLAAAGMDSANVWYSRTADVQEAWRYAGLCDLDAAPAVPGVFVTATTLKDPAARSDGLHTLEAFCYASADAFARWRGTETGERGDKGYDELKERLSLRMLEALDAVVPGISRRVVFRELATPLTNQFYVGATAGAMYGIEKSLRNIGPLALGAKTPIRGLFQCGASTFVPGVFGAATSGLVAAASALGVPSDALLDPRAAALTTLLCDRPEEWPLEHRPRVVAPGEKETEEEGASGEGAEEEEASRA